MKNLELNRMEQLIGGDNCDNLDSVVLLGETATWAAGATLVAGPFSLALFAAGAVWLTYSYAECAGMV